jgi:hypothetical protein
VSYERITGGNFLRQVAQIAEYQAYIIGVDGRFLRAVELVCPDDETPKEYAKQLVDGHELWQHDRKIAAFKHTRE